MEFCHPSRIVCKQWILTPVSFFFFFLKEEEFLCMKNDTFKDQTHCLGIFYANIRDWNAKFCLQFLLCEAFFISVQDFRSGLLPSPSEMEPSLSYHLGQSFSFPTGDYYDFPKSWFFTQLSFQEKVIHVQILCSRAKKLLKRLPLKT